MVLQLGSSCRQKRADIYCKTLRILSKAPGSLARGGLGGPIPRSAGACGPPPYLGAQQQAWQNNGCRSGSGCGDSQLCP